MFVIFLIARHTAPHDCTHTDTCHHVVQPKREIPNRHHLACAESKKDFCYVQYAQVPSHSPNPVELLSYSADITIIFDINSSISVASL